MQRTSVFTVSSKAANFDRKQANVSAPKQHTTPRIIDTSDVRFKLASGVLGAAAAISLALAPPSLASGSFLKSTGGRGLLAQEEEELLKLREIEEGKIREEIALARAEFEEETKLTKPGQLCATPFGIDVVGITEFIALTGALVGGVSARRRKDELERLNEQLRTINTQLRQQARAGTLYAPGLTYVPSPLQQDQGQGSAGIASPPSNSIKLSLPSLPQSTIPSTANISAPTQPITTPADATPVVVSNAVAAPAVSLMSIDEEDLRPEVKQCQNALKDGKKFLKDQNPGAAMVRFEKALMLAKSLADKVRERRAVRGLAAACRISGQQRQAINYLQRVLEISNETGDHVGDADAYGTIADIYTDIGEFEKAAEFYDKYIERMNTDGPV